MELLGFPHFISDILRRELARARRLPSRVACLLIAIDDPSSISRKYGYMHRDKIFRTFRNTIRKSCRAIDICEQDGKGNFIIILPETDRRSAEICAQRITYSLRNIRINPGNAEATSDEFELDLSVGLSVYPDPRVRTENDLIALANEALQMVKKQQSDHLVVA
jgi:diguanylate cyclase (GGDEF)-like protein